MLVVTISLHGFVADQIGHYLESAQYRKKERYGRNRKNN